MSITYPFYHPDLPTYNVLRTYKLTKCTNIKCPVERCSWLHDDEVFVPSKRLIGKISAFIKNGELKFFVNWQAQISDKEYKAFGHGKTSLFQISAKLQKIAAKPKISKQIPDAVLPMRLLKEVLQKTHDLEPEDKEFLGGIPDEGLPAAPQLSSQTII